MRAEDVPVPFHTSQGAVIRCDWPFRTVLEPGLRKAAQRTELGASA